MNPAMIALGGANPGLMPLAFLHGRTGYAEPEFEDFTDAQMTVGFCMVGAFLAIAFANLYLIGALW